MMDAARGLVAFVAFVTAIGGLLSDYSIPASGRQHIKNPRSPPHAKFHNAQTILMGFGLGILSLSILFRQQAMGTNGLVLAAILASLYWIGIFAGPIFPGTACVDPELRSLTSKPMGLPFSYLLDSSLWPSTSLLSPWLFCQAILLSFAERYMRVDQHAMVSALAARKAGAERSAPQ